MPYKDKEKQKEYQREWHAKRRAAYFSDKCCASCGSMDDLELDHIDPEQKIHHNIWSWAATRRDAELAKCQVLCHDCHWTKTHTDLGYAEDWHGSATGYVNHRCRCSACREWRSQYRRITE